MTLGLSQITNDAQATKVFLQKYGQYFDKYFITVGDKTKKEFYELQKLEDKKLNLSYFKTPTKPEDLDFSSIRNYNLKLIDTDYWFWADSDDELTSASRLPDLLTYALNNQIDVIQLKYDYAQNVNGEAISDHIRERLIKTKLEGKWDAPVHETFQPVPCIWEQSDWVGVKHQKDQSSVNRSAQRNQIILQKHWVKTHDPRDAMYLGMLSVADKDYKQGIAWFQRHIETSGSDQDIYRSWCKVAEYEWILGRAEQALYATDEAIKLKPSWPDAFFIKVIILGSQEKFDDAIEWMKVAASKPIPETLSMLDPTLYKYRGLANGAQCYLFSGQVREAYKLYSYVKEQNPKFWDEMSEADGVQWDKVFEEAYFDQKAIDSTKWLLHYTKGEHGKPEKLFEALPERIFADSRLSPERMSFLPKKVWTNSIVIYTGQGSEPWGPDTLETDGLGGSEEAVVYLSRELAKLGWDVTVFNERDEEYLERWDDKKWYAPVDDLGQDRNTSVLYKPWTLFNPNDEFDVFVAWRVPSFIRNIKARLKVIDMHDMPTGYATVTKAVEEAVDKVFFKSKFQAKQVNIPKSKKVIVGNGIVKEQFDV